MGAVPHLMMPLKLLDTLNKFYNFFKKNFIDLT